MKKEHDSNIGETTKVPLVWLAGCVIACCVGVLFVYQIKTDVADLKKMIWSRTDMRDWSDSLRESNQDIAVPKVDISKVENFVPNKNNPLYGAVESEIKKELVP